MMLRPTSKLCCIVRQVNPPLDNLTHPPLGQHGKKAFVAAAGSRAAVPALAQDVTAGGKPHAGNITMSYGAATVQSNGSASTR